MNTRAVIVMGVSGSGKTTLGTALAKRLGWEFVDADDYHPQANREKMARGQPLNDNDRQPWLEILHRLLADHVREGRPLVLACSALKQKYRDTLMQGMDGVALVYPHGSQDLIAERLRERGSSHFMPVSLLDSQFETLEPPTNAIEADIRRPTSELVSLIMEQL
ncbi:gluconokinase [Deinococcus fonticola]|uniref:gluconokinase n=1 Tax=Deinococcus fonticola TaxID=2528713 RepID=UPI001074B9DF|nr:gluconokinase [Deinococcus fonticola]